MRRDKNKPIQNPETVKEVLKRDIHLGPGKPNTKWRKRLQEILLTHADEIFTDKLMSECSDEASKSTECELCTKKGIHIFLFKMYCEDH